MEKKEEKAKEYSLNMYKSYTGYDKLDIQGAYRAGWDEALKSQWVKVEDGLPEAGKKVLVLFKFEDDYLIMEDIRTNAQTKDNWYHGKSKVIAWMEIPSYEHIIKGK